MVESLLVQTSFLYFLTYSLETQLNGNLSRITKVKNMNLNLRSGQSCFKFKVD